MGDFFSAADEEPPDDFRTAMDLVPRAMHNFTLSLQEATALGMYTSNGGYELNGCLKAGFPFVYDHHADCDHEVLELDPPVGLCGLAARWISWVRDASAILSKKQAFTPKDGLWRCVPTAHVKDFKAGDVYAERGFFSTSHGKCPKDFGGAALHLIDPPVQDGFLAETFSPHKSEHEFLLMPGHWYLVAAIHEGSDAKAKGYGLVIDLEHCGTYDQPLQKCLDKVKADGKKFDERLKNLPGERLSGVKCTAFKYSTK